MTCTKCGGLTYLEYMYDSKEQPGYNKALSDTCLLCGMHHWRGNYKPIPLRPEGHRRPRYDLRSFVTKVGL